MNKYLNYYDWCEEFGLKLYSPKYKPGKMGTVNIKRCEALSAGKNQSKIKANDENYKIFLLDWLEKNPENLMKLEREDFENFCREAMRFFDRNFVETFLEIHPNYDRIESNQWKYNK